MPGQWIGLKEANRALRSLPDHVKANVQKTIDVTAFQVLNGARQRVRRRTGRLSDRYLAWQSRPRSLSAVVGVAKEGYYWKYLEYGTVHMPAFPFLRPAAEAMRADHDARMIETLERAANQTAQEQGAFSGSAGRTL